MCGIAGFSWKDPILLKQMVSCISHRGPDDQGVHLGEGISLGHRRLSILDLSKKGHQPMYNSRKDVVIVFNGEIYNYPELKRNLEERGCKFKSGSDTEAIVYGYQEYGEKIIEMLEGMFAFAIWDIKKKKLILARDRIGEKPLYYHYSAGRISFASEIKSIIANKSIKREVNLQCLSDFLTLRYSPGDQTMFEGIMKLPPSSYLIFEKGKIIIKKYWTIPKFKESYAGDTREVDHLIETSIKERLLSDVPIGVFLSGGLDSSTIVAYLSRFQKNIKTFSVGFGDSTDETKYAEIIAKKFKTDHLKIILKKDVIELLPEVVWHLDEPLADPAALPTYQLCKEVSKHVKVALSGEGGDEVFGGYQTYNYIPKIEQLYKIPLTIRKKLLSPLLRKSSSLFEYPLKQMLSVGSEVIEEKTRSLMHEKLFYFPFNTEEKKRIFGPKVQKVSLENPIFKYTGSNKSLWNGTREYYFSEWLPNDLLMKVDKMSMAHGLEVRPPFLDTDLISYFAQLNINETFKRSLLKRTVNNLLPREILKRKKQGFTLPISNWFSDGKYSERFSKHILNLASRGYFQREELLNILQNARDFKNDHKLWVLLTFELWCKMYLDNIPFSKISLK